MAGVAGRVALSAAAVVGDADLAVISETIWYLKPRLSYYMFNLQFTLLDAVYRQVYFVTCLASHFVTWVGILLYSVSESRLSWHKNTDNLHNFSKCNNFKNFVNYSYQRWKPIGSTGTGRVDRPVGLPVGSRFFDRPVKPVEKPVEFSFLATKRHLSTNQIYLNILS